ncbi:hypothetical protein R8Z50_23170 [Longispora sp. K20-0274]|uniref:hypothetical protein n=1 Tax=Longispora sp. K20-0274 TaxID=3088255 RepID=UPI00399A7357
MDAERARRAAWDAYVVVSATLLPTLDGRSTGEADGRAQLVGLSIAVHRDAPLWAEHGGMLIAAVNSAVRLRRAGHIGELHGLLRAMAHRLFLLSGADPAALDT